MRTKTITEKNIASTIIYTIPWRLAKVKPLENYRLDVEFIDGTRGFIEMKQLIMSKNAGVFAKLRDIHLFNRVRLEYGVVTWPGEIDLAPDAMYDEIKHHGVWIIK